MKVKLKSGKTRKVQQLIFKMLDVLDTVGVLTNDLTERSLERIAMSVMAIGQIKNSFTEAKSTEDGIFLKTRDIIEYENNNYSENISPGSYDDIRRKDLVLPVEAKIVLNSASLIAQPTNSPSRAYALNPLFAKLLRNWDTPEKDNCLNALKQEIGSLKEELARNREMNKIPLTLPNGVQLELSAGEHNVLQKSIIEDFLPRFGMNSELLYLGDTSDKYLYLNQEKLSALGYFEVDHEELPDVIAYSEQSNVLFLIEAYHSTGQWSEIRVRKLKQRLENCTARIIYVTAFEDMRSFRKKSASIAWETEVWVADNPEHMIHFNGDKFLKVFN